MFTFRRVNSIINELFRSKILSNTLAMNHDNFLGFLNMVAFLQSQTIFSWVIMSTVENSLLRVYAYYSLIRYIFHQGSTDPIKFLTPTHCGNDCGQWVTDLQVIINFLNGIDR